MKLLPNWKDAWKWFSIQVAVIGAGLQAAIIAFPSLKDWLGDFIVHCVGLLILVGIVASRLVDQSKPNNG